MRQSSLNTSLVNVFLRSSYFGVLTSRHHLRKLCLADLDPVHFLSVFRCGGVVSGLLC